LQRLLASVYRVISKHLGDSRFSGIAAISESVVDVAAVCLCAC
jgi:hypothetical protein